MTRKQGARGAHVSVFTAAGERYDLRPVPMKLMPSGSPSLWLKFQGLHIPGALLTPEDQQRVQAFMRKHRTEALSDGSLTLTLAGGCLAQCFPEAIQPTTTRSV